MPNQSLQILTINVIITILHPFECEIERLYNCYQAPGSTIALANTGTETDGYLSYPVPFGALDQLESETIVYLLGCVSSEIF